MKTIEICGKRFGEERALYGSQNVHVVNCAFDGEEDGESALKESSDVCVEDTFCNLRYPFWHDTRLQLRRCKMSTSCRAPLWYSEQIEITDTQMHGVKALRECSDVTINGCDIVSPEFGWSVSDVHMKNSKAEGEYFMMRAVRFSLENVRFKGKYSFQYVEDGVIENCELDTKDALWHARNVTVRNCTVNGEYLAWYSENVTFVDCKIRGTQPFCYCKGLKLINCEMHGADLAFERSEVEADVTTPMISIKNPRAGRITLPRVEELIMDDSLAACEVVFKD